MYKTVQNCEHCGANLKLDDMRRDECPYCGVVYPHKSMAQQHAEVASHMMGNIMQQQAQVQNQFRAGFGGPQYPVQHPQHAFPPAIHAQQARTAGNIIMVVVIVSVVAALLVVGLAVAMFLFV